MHAIATSSATAPRPHRRRWRRRLGTLLVVAGVAVLGWALFVWQWNDPFTALYTRWQQHQLEATLTELVRDESARPSAGQSVPKNGTLETVASDARRFARSVEEGDPIGRIVVPRLDLDMVMVNGTETHTLKKGPGRHLATAMPGQGHLVYVAGHRTTYLAPFARIDDLRPGDRVTLEMPYATMVYEVVRHVIVDDEDLSVLRSRGREELALQACHPRFRATQRYVVFALPVTVTPRGGTPIKVPRARAVS